LDCPGKSGPDAKLSHRGFECLALVVWNQRYFTTALDAVVPIEATIDKLGKILIN
jgi:hypothetical protein